MFRAVVCLSSVVLSLLREAVSNSSHFSFLLFLAYYISVLFRIFCRNLEFFISFFF